MKTAKPFGPALAAVLFSLLFCFTPSPALALDVNTASSEELQTLKGVGPKRAEAIVRYREANGPFKSIEALQDVPGVGPSMIEDNAGQLELSKKNLASGK